MSRSSFNGFPQPKKDSNGTKTGDATAAAADILILKTAYGPLGKIVGAMPDNGANSFNPSTSSQPIPLGKYNGSGVVNPVTGTAAVGDVLSGKTFASANGIGITGTIPDNGAGTSGVVSAVNTGINGTTLYYRIPYGAYLHPNGSGYSEITYSDANFIAANIPYNLSMFGLVGTFSNIKSVQYGDFSMSGTSADIAISAVDLTKAVVIMSYTSGTDAANAAMPMAQLTSTTNINFSTMSSSNSTISWRVVEFNNVKSLQSGTVTVSGGGSVLKTISAVNMGKSIIFGSFKTSDSNTNARHQMQRWHLQSSTTAEVYFGESITSGTGYFYVVEFN